jgi:hypothetical protein
MKMAKREKGELFMDAKTDNSPIIKKSVPALCLCCMRAMDTATPYPQLCTLCRQDASGSLTIVAHEVDELETTWRTALRASQIDTQQRFVSMMESASSAYGPGTAMKRKEAIDRFNVRLDASILQGGEFAMLASKWRQWKTRSSDRDLIQIMLAFTGEGVQK